MPATLLLAPATLAAAPTARPRAGLAPGLDGAPAASLLPCSLAAGWEVVARARLPRRDAAGRSLGGFSALRHDAALDRLELLSDAPWGLVSRWRGLMSLVGRPAAPLPLTQDGLLPLRAGAGEVLPQPIDAEAMERWRARLWVASEGRRTQDRPARLLRFSAAGRLEEVLELPPAWRAGPARGLEANRGPESLALLRRPGGGEGLLMAAERPLLQDPPDRVRLLEWLPAPAAPAGPAQGAPSLVARELAPLALPPRGDWGLTELLPVAEGRQGVRLLALLRRFEPPDSWDIRLALYPLSSAVAAGSEDRVRPVAPLHLWRLAVGGSGSEPQPPGRTLLPADNWEGLAFGPRLADGRPTLLLVSDDNFNPLQENHLALLAPRRNPACGRPEP